MFKNKVSTTIKWKKIYKICILIGIVIGLIAGFIVSYNLLNNN